MTPLWFWEENYFYFGQSVTTTFHYGPPDNSDKWKPVRYSYFKTVDIVGKQNPPHNT